MGCSSCAKNYPETFEMRGNKAYIKNSDGALDAAKLANVIEGCPVHAITYSGDAETLSGISSHNT